MIVAVDCDLRRIHALTSDKQRVCYQEPVQEAALLAVSDLNPALVLFEIASPVHYNASPNRLYHKNRWALWNMATATKFALHFEARGIEFLVSPSSDWTRGYPEADRQRIAGCSQPNHDLREAEAMLFFYRVHSQAWKRLDDFLGEL